MEKTKAKIELIKTLFLVFVTALFSEVGYGFINFNKLDSEKLFILIYAIIFTGGITMMILISWINKIKELKD